jgi:hypothetical protein
MSEKEIISDPNRTTFSTLNNIRYQTINWVILITSVVFFIISDTIYRGTEIGNVMWCVSTVFFFELILCDAIIDILQYLKNKKKLKSLENYQKENC